MDPTKVAGTVNLTNFPTRFSGTYDGTGGEADLRSVANGGKVVLNGGNIDIRFETTGGTQLDHVIRNYVATTGVIEAAVEIDTLDYDDNTEILIYYGKSLGVTEQDEPGTYGDYFAVWGLDDASSPALDSTANNNDLSQANSPTFAQMGKMYQAVSFDGSDDQLSASHAASQLVGGSLTISGWVYPDDFGEAGAVFQKRASATYCDTNYNYGFWINTSGDLLFEYGASCTALTSTNSNLGTASWQHVALVIDETGDTATFYKNGVQTDQVAHTGTIPNGGTGTLYVGGYNYTGAPSATYNFDGLMDDVRGYAGLRTVGWLLTEYNSSNDPATFYTIGSEVESSGARRRNASVIAETGGLYLLPAGGGEYVITNVSVSGTVSSSGHGDNFHTTWSDDDSQYTSLGDGKGWEDSTEWNTRVYRLTGDAPSFTPVFLSGYLDIPYATQHWYGYGIVSVGGTLYQWIGYLTKTGLIRFIGSKLVYSTDHGATWKNHDGSAMSVPESPDASSMFTWGNSDDSFSLIGTVQMGKDYSENTDGYVYIFAPNGNTDSLMRQLIMARVPVDEILTEGSYEYRTATGWSSTFADRSPIYTFPSGWVGSDFAYAWHPAITYIPQLRLYLMAAGGTAKNNGTLFNAESYLGMYTAPEPWGPWTQVYEDTTWYAGVDTATRLYEPVIAPKWVGSDGLSFWLVFSDAKGWPGTLPNYKFNLSEVTLTVDDPGEEACSGVAVETTDDPQDIIDANVPGTTYCFATGVHRNRTFTPKIGDTIWGDTGTVLNGSTVLTGWSGSGPWTVNSGVTDAGWVHGECDPAYPMCGYPKDLWLDNVRMRHVATAGEVGAGEFHHNYTTGVITLGTDPSSATVELAGTYRAINGSAVSSVTVRDLTVEKYATSGQYAAVDIGPSGVVARLDASRNHSRGLSVASNVTIVDSTFNHNGQLGIGSYSTLSAPIENVSITGGEVAYNNEAGFSGGWEAGGTKLFFLDGLLIDDVYVHDNYAWGLWQDTEVINVVIQNCLIEGNANAGIFHEASGSAEFRYNTVQNNSQGYYTWGWGGQILVNASDHVTIHHNTVTANVAGGDGIMILNQNRTRQSTDSYVHHNTVYGYCSSGCTSGMMADYDNTPPGIWADNNVWDYNVYHLPNNGSYFEWENSTMNFATWQGEGNDVNGSIVTP